MDLDALSDRLWPETLITEEGCWEWQGGVYASGYGRIQFQGRDLRIHRAVYLAFVEPILPGLELDHLCRNRRCWNPDHVEAVTHAENMRRARGLGQWKRRSHCARGHPFTAANTYDRSDGQRMCRACLRLRDRKRSSGWQRQRTRERSGADAGAV